MIKQAVILAGGLGTRMLSEDKGSLGSEEKDLLGKGLKGLIKSDDGRPIFDSSIQFLVNAGIKKLIFVVNKQGKEVLEKYYGKKIAISVDVEYAIQEKPLGTANAVLAAEKKAGGEPFVVLFYDNVYPEDDIKILVSSDAEWGAIGFDRDALENPEISNLKKVKVRQCAVMQVDEDYYLKRIVEAAGDEQDNYRSHDGKILISMSLFSFDKDIFEACKKIEPRERRPGIKEYELPDAVQYGINNMGKRLKVFYQYSGIIDLTSIEDIESARKLTKNREIRFKNKKI